MDINNSYLFRSERLGFRNWNASDIPMMIEINQDRDVMEFFPNLIHEIDTISFIQRMQTQYLEKKFCYFAVDLLSTNEFIGFIGLSEQNFESNFTPCIDIGWRLSIKYWNKAYATEGAKKCLAYGLDDLNIPRIYAIAPKINTKSEHVMKKIGMKKLGEFEHPKLLNNERLKCCILYEKIQE